MHYTRLLAFVTSAILLSAQDESSLISSVNLKMKYDVIWDEDESTCAKHGYTLFEGEKAFTAKPEMYYSDKTE